MRDFFVEGIELSIRNTTRRMWANNRKLTLENMAHQAQSLLDLQSVHRKNGQERRVKIVRHSTKEPKGREKPRRVVAVKNTSSLSTSNKASRSLDKHIGTSGRLSPFSAIHK